MRYVIYMQLIKELRNKTGAGMVDCKKALDETNNDLEKAVEILRKKGIAKAAKRGAREATEGIVLVDTNSEKNKGYILEINSETDFVSRNAKFQAFAQAIFDVIKNNNPANLEELFNLKLADSSNTVKEDLETLSGTIGEKLIVKRFEIIVGATVSAYSHMNGKIGVLLSLDTADKDELAGDIAMHIAATDPKYLQPEDVNPDEINKEKEIYKEQLIKAGKPENIIDKILVGKINKYFEEICLLKQEYIKDDKKKIEEILEKTKIEKFTRYSL